MSYYNSSFEPCFKYEFYSTALKKAFVADKSIQKMAKQDFIMLNLVAS